MLLVKNTKIYTMANSIIENGDILVKDGKITEIGENLTCEGAEIVQGEGLIALPGFIDAHSHIGGFNFNVKNSDDVNEMTNVTTAHMEAIYSVDVTSKDFEYSYKSGITSIAITPGSGNVICGQVFATKTYGTNIFDMTIKNPISLKVALGGNPKGVYGKRNQAPMTRMSIPVIIRDLLNKSKEYMEKKEKGEKVEFNQEYEAVIPVLKKEMPMKVHCTQFDMLTAIEIAKEYGIDFSLEHAWGATDYIEEIVESGCDVAFGPIGVMRSASGERSKIDIESVVELDNRGVNVALVTDAPILRVDSLFHHLGEAVREGCHIERALRMVTINPAKLMGVDHRVGSLEVGKDADIVLFKGLPGHETNAKAVLTIIDGKVVYAE